MFPVTNQVIHVKIAVMRDIYRTSPSAIDASRSQRSKPIGTSESDCKPVSRLLTEQSHSRMNPVVNFRKRVLFRQNEIQCLFEESVSKNAGVTTHSVMTVRTLAHDPRKKENTDSGFSDPRCH